jgi:hypothetical protein
VTFAVFAEAQAAPGATTADPHNQPTRPDSPTGSPRRCARRRGGGGRVAPGSSRRRSWAGPLSVTARNPCRRSNSSAEPGPRTACQPSESRPAFAPARPDRWRRHCSRPLLLQSGRVRSSSHPSTDAPPRHRAGDRQRRSLSREPRVVVCQRRYVPGGRRPHRCVRRATISFDAAHHAGAPGPPMRQNRCFMTSATLSEGPNEPA